MFINQQDNAPWSQSETHLKLVSHGSELSELRWPPRCATHPEPQSSAMTHQKQHHVKEFHTMAPGRNAFIVCHLYKATCCGYTSEQQNECIDEKMTFYCIVRSHHLTRKNNNSSAPSVKFVAAWSSPLYCAGLLQSRTQHFLFTLVALDTWEYWHFPRLSRVVSSQLHSAVNSRTWCPAQDSFSHRTNWNCQNKNTLPHYM